ncbi:MAG: LacI family transcriptional regulator, partial [Chitinophagaceae bacterium]
WLISRGYKRIALINGPDKLGASKERLNGYIEGHSRKKIKVDMQLVEKTDLSKEGTYAALEMLLARKNRPQVVITFNEYVHMDAVQYAQQKNILVNRDVVFASYANLPITNYTAHPPLVSVEQYPYGQGEKAMEIMIGLLGKKMDADYNPNEFQVEEMPATLVMHPNTRP